MKLSPLSVEQWAEHARYDLGTAEVLMKAGRYLYVLFCCQQAIEKLLKAIILKEQRDEPPFLHNLIRLAEIAELELNDTQSEALQALSTFYIKTRYEEEMRKLYLVANAKYSNELFHQTREVFQWLQSLMK